MTHGRSATTNPLAFPPHPKPHLLHPPQLHAVISEGRQLMPGPAVDRMARGALSYLGRLVGRWLLVAPDGVKAYNLYAIERLAVGE